MSNEKAIDLKLDKAKAYDWMEWDFLGIVLEAFRFHKKFIKIIQECILSVSFSILLNKSPFGLVTVAGGIRKGNHFSLLFIIGAEVISWICCKKKRKRAIHGAKVYRSVPSISHLFFTDDSLRFCNAKITDVKAIQDTLDDYCFLSK